MTNDQKSFEHSLRSASPYAPLLRPIKSEIHKGCTGRAHGCGTRKNSRSTYSSLSDSSSEASGVRIEATHSSSLPRRTQSFNKQKDKSTTSDESSAVLKSPVKIGTKPRNGNVTDSKPPWHNVYTAKLTGLKGNETDRCGSQNENRDRVKKTKKVSVHWQELYEKCNNQKVYGGSYGRYTFSENSGQVISITNHMQMCLYGIVFIIVQ